MKRPRTPPKKWRRNMAAAVVFLAILDAIIISSTPNLTRTTFAILVTIVVGFVVAKIWRSNIEFEKAATPGTKAAPTGKR